MRSRPQVRPTLEALEGRICLTTSARVVQGSLFVLGTGGTALTITQVDLRTFRVDDGSNPVGVFGGVVRDVDVRLDGANDSVVVDLQGLTTPRNLSLSLGGGSNDVLIGNGSIGGDLGILGGPGRDGVALGIAASPRLEVMGSTYVNGVGGGADSLGTAGTVVVDQNLFTYGVNTLILAPSSDVRGGANVVAGPNAAANRLDGRVGRDLVFTGSPQADYLEVSTTGIVGRNLVTNLANGDDLAVFNGRIFDTLYLVGDGGDDEVALGGGVGSSAFLLLGQGNDRAFVSGTIGATGTKGLLNIDGSFGDDTVTFADSAALNGRGTVYLGAGNDLFVIGNVASPLNIAAFGGSGTNTFVGNRANLRIRPLQFQIYT